MWNETQTILLETAEETIGFKQRQKQKMWISDETFAIVKEKREAKSKCPEKYRELKTVVQRHLRGDKQQYLDGVCKEAEDANANGNTRKWFQIVRAMTQEFKPRFNRI